jgi:hypothetical protein
MKTRNSELKIIIEEVMNEASGLAKADPKKMAKGSLSGPRPNEKAITKLAAGANGFSALTTKLTNNIEALKKAKAIDASAAQTMHKSISKMIKDYRSGSKAKNDQWKKTGKQ